MADKILMNKNTLAALKAELKEYNTALPVFGTAIEGIGSAHREHYSSFTGSHCRDQ